MASRRIEVYGYEKPVVGDLVFEDSLPKEEKGEEEDEGDEGEGKTVRRRRRRDILNERISHSMQK